MNQPDLTRRALITAAAIVPAAAVRGSAANSTVTVGLIGCGGRGTYDATLLAKEVPDARLVALADLFPDRIDRAQQATGISDAKKYPSGDALLSAGGIDAVIIATPVYLHPEHFEAAVRAGKHIYMEKPAGADVAGVKRLLRAADSAPRNLNITFGFQQRYGPGYRKAKALADSGGIGRIVAAHSYWVKNQVSANRPQEARPTTDREKVLQWHEWRDLFGDYIVENNVHGIDVLNWFLGAHPTSAVGTGGRTLIKYGDNTDHSYVTFDYPNNVQGHLNGTMIAPRFYRDVKEQFFGETGVIETHREFWRHYRGAGDVVEEKEQRKDITSNALEEFIRRVREGKPENTAHSAAESTLTAIMGRMATDARHEVTWDQMMKSA
jgi:myo-inositol 2-dehydrogenase/D-chiro-inositol 1-dehydrogenase